MKRIFEKNFRHFALFYKYVGNRVFILILSSLLVGLFDGFGLALFIPVFSLAADGNSTNPTESLGELKFLMDWITALGFGLTLNVIMGVMILLFLIKALLKFFDGYYKVKLQNMFVRKLRYQMVDGLGDLEYKKFLYLDAGRIQNTLSSEASKVTYGFLAYFNTVQYVVLLGVYITLALLSNFQFAIMVSIGGYLSNFVFRYLFKNTERASVGVSKLGHIFQSYLVQSVHNFKYLKATDYFSKYKLKLKSIIDQIEVNQRKIGIYSAIMSSTREPIILIVVIAIIIAQINLFGGTIGSILLSLVFFYRALNYIITLQASWQSFISNFGGLSASVEIIQELQDGREDLKFSKDVGKITNVQLDNLSFQYPNGTQVLKNINLEIKKLKTYALVGGSGSGKTTMVNIIIGLFTPTSGRILVNGDDRIELNLASFRRRFGYITQEPVIFNDSLYNNVALWAEKTPENIEKFFKAIQMADLTEFLKTLKENEDTNLGDHGLLVSGGQKQRISIAREMYKDVDILIFDEATSSLDSETERAIKENIDALKGKFTIIIIAHRLSTVKKADNISLLDKGEIVGEGNFEDLILSNKMFKRMVELQEF